MNVITLITDFGYEGWYTGELKGSMLSVCSDIQIIDITHATAPGDIRSAAFTLCTSFASFPEKTVFCVVVDPAVRGSRRPIAVYVNKRYLVGPDNGVLSWMLRNKPAVPVRQIEPGKIFRDMPSPQPYSDIFGPAAAYLAAGNHFPDLGPEINDMISLPFPPTSITPDVLTTEVIAIDHFGNIIMAAENRFFDTFPKHIELSVGTLRTTAATASSYEQVPQGDMLVYRGSSGYIEIGINGGRASDYFSTSSGDAVRISLR